MRYFDVHVSESRKNGYSVYLKIKKDIIGEYKSYDEEQVIAIAVEKKLLTLTEAEMVDNTDELTKEEFIDMVGHE